MRQENCVVSHPCPAAGLLLGRLLLFVRTEVREMSEDNLPRGGHQSGHQSQGRGDGWLGRIRNNFYLKAMDKDFHVDCFTCDSCGCQLSEDSNSRFVGIFKLNDRR